MNAAAPLFVTSGDLAADRRYQWALDHAARGDFSAAADILLQTVELAPAFATAWFALGAIRDRLGERDAAIAAFDRAQRLDPDDYHGARLQLARLGAGEAVPAMTASYVRRLFDQYAARFETALVERLDYCGPALLREAVAAVMWQADRPLRFDIMLDLGCGTGLAGVAFRPFAGSLVGVDLSPAMIAQAQAKDLYRRLVAADVLDALKVEAAEQTRYDLAIAADVFVYVNELGPIVDAVSGIITPDGLFAFTVETHAGEGVKLLPTLRYAHAEDYVRAVLRNAGLAVARIDRKPIRSEKAVPVDSLVVVAQPSTEL
jgi:predicted TPR repeat methyltransferase